MFYVAVRVSLVSNAQTTGWRRSGEEFGGVQVDVCKNPRVRNEIKYFLDLISRDLRLRSVTKVESGEVSLDKRGK